MLLIVSYQWLCVFTGTSSFIDYIELNFPCNYRIPQLSQLEYRTIAVISNRSTRHMLVPPLVIYTYEESYAV